MQQGAISATKPTFIFWLNAEMPVELKKNSFSPYAPKKGEEYMNAKQRSHFRKILENLKGELSQ
ncbi:MAG TPA: hypothetical protein VLZ09_01625, partial [Gaiellaceae bacterium]|nr:hypothetical protein [Gaiellaceae bacterium]